MDKQIYMYGIIGILIIVMSVSGCVNSTYNYQSEIDQAIVDRDVEWKQVLIDKDVEWEQVLVDRDAEYKQAIVDRDVEWEQICIQLLENRDTEWEQLVINRDEQWKTSIKQTSDQETLNYILQILPYLI